MIYALLITEGADPELVRIPVKGSSLGSEVKADTTTDLYSYLSSFSPDEHMWEYYTVLSPVLEKGKQQYFAIDFKRGDRVQNDVIAGAVVSWLRVVRDNIAAVDKARQEKIAAGVTAAPAAEIQVEVQEVEEEKNIYPENEPNPDAMPW